MVTIFAAASLSAASKTVVFDYGDVLAFPDRKIVVQYLTNTFELTEEAFEKINQEKRASGETAEDFWMKYAQRNGFQLPENWPEIYRDVIKSSFGVDAEMYNLIDELKRKNIQVGLLSNIVNPYATMIRAYGLYEPFNPCILSCDIGIEKPDLKAYQILLKRVSCPAKDVVFIDDKIENIEAAKKMGIDGIVFESPAQIRQELEKRNLL